MKTRYKVFGTDKNFVSREVVIECNNVEFLDNGIVIFFDWQYRKWYQKPYKKLVVVYTNGNWTKIERA